MTYPRDSSQRPRRFQFSLRQTFAVILALSVCLALVTQLRHVGFVAAVFLGGLAAGMVLQRWKLAAASATGLFVFAVTTLSCWVSWGTGPAMFDDWTLFSPRQFQPIQEELEAYKEKHQDYPDSLQELDADILASEPLGPAVEEFRDGWGHPYFYQRTEDGYVLASLGRDRKLGGQGLDADIYMGDDLPKLITWKQFLFETPGSGIVFGVSLAAAFVSAPIWFVGQAGAPFPLSLRMAGVGTISVLSIVVATFLAAVYLSTFLHERH